MSRLKIAMTAKFRRQLKRIRKRGWNIEELQKVIELLQRQQTLPTKYGDHALTGNRFGQRDLHIRPDWVLIYAVDEDILVLELIETGTHSDLDL